MCGFITSSRVLNLGFIWCHPEDMSVIFVHIFSVPSRVPDKLHCTGQLSTAGTKSLTCTVQRREGLLLFVDSEVSVHKEQTTQQEGSAEGCVSEQSWANGAREKGTQEQIQTPRPCPRDTRHNLQYALPVP